MKRGDLQLPPSFLVILLLALLLGIIFFSIIIWGFKNVFLPK
ncbi:MAG TPA: hypothetical protein VI894_02455 [Candidatus Nanoarchaeia archaeon]|nr:hypothetical protein [Candidatus Nanoarchaeia archaeon]